MAIIKCPECGHQVSNLAKTCPSCGVDIAGNLLRCPDCGELVLKNQEMCPNCHLPMQGAVLSEVDERSTASVTQHVPSPVQSGEALAVDTQQQKPKRKKTYTGLLVGFVIALLIVLLMVYFYQDNQRKAEMRAYENAMLSNEPAVMQNYLDMYATAPTEHRNSVQAHLDEVKRIDLEWSNAVVSESRSMLQQYIDNHPGNVHVPEARLLIDSIDWAIAERANSQDGYRHYMEEHGDGEHYDEARSAYDTLEEQRRAREKAQRDSLAAADTVRSRSVAP